MTESWAEVEILLIWERICTKLKWRCKKWMNLICKIDGERSILKKKIEITTVGIRTRELWDTVHKRMTGMTKDFG